MRRTTLILFFVSTIVLFNSCRKESEIIESLETGTVAGKSAYRILSLVHIVEQIAMERNDDFFTSQTMISKTDSTYLDGDGISYLLDFGKGVLCSDGILRKGKCRLEMVDTMLPVKGSCIFHMEVSDSFGVFAKTGWEHVHGSLEWEKLTVDSATLHLATLDFRNASNGFTLSTSGPISIRYVQPITNAKNGEIWNGIWNINIHGTSQQIIATDISNAGACRSNWNKGTLEVPSSKPHKIELDPFGNNACDQVFKVSRGKGFRTDEMTFDAW
jgi:hypothetical protein